MGFQNANIQGREYSIEGISDTDDNSMWQMGHFREYFIESNQFKNGPVIVQRYYLGKVIHDGEWKDVTLKVLDPAERLTREQLKDLEDAFPEI